MHSQTWELPSRGLYNLVADGAECSIVKTGGSGSLGITSPKDELEERGLGAGVHVIIMPRSHPTNSSFTSPRSMSETVPLIRIGESGSLGITLPKEKLDERGLEAGDEVGIVTTGDSDVLKIQLPPKQGE